ncbi:MAG TPA: N-acetylglucosamine-6-phosphate deacetylase [Vicinamibacterales bacterium]|nr:N-acetylglucosamine-6-phosphate deacetylase [Vicinamibacterales bacterium]
MIVLSGADLVLPGGVQSRATLVIDGERIADVSSATASPASSTPLDGHIIVPGFIDVHVHGVEGIDALDGSDATAAIARRLPKFGVTAFCPTTVACGPARLRHVLESVARLRGAIDAAARVLPAHLESNFINPDYRGAQPFECLRTPLDALGLPRRSGAAAKAGAEDFDAADILAEIDRAGGAVGIVTLAPELDGALDLIRHLVSKGRRVSLGHSGADMEQGRAAIEAGATQATHLFNRMPPFGHREPGLVGAILSSERVAAEVICDGVHVHSEVVRMAVSTKGTARMMAITDGVAVAGMPEGSTALLGGRQIRVNKSAAYLEDGTLAGSVATMDRVFRFLVRDVGLSLVDAVHLCSTTPAAELSLTDLGTITKDAIADLVVLDRDFHVKQTYVAGRLVYNR